MAKAGSFDIPGWIPSLAGCLFSRHFIDILCVPYIQGLSSHTNPSGWNSPLSGRLVPGVCWVESYGWVEGDAWISSE